LTSWDKVRNNSFISKKKKAWLYYKIGAKPFYYSARSVKRWNAVTVSSLSAAFK